MFGYAISKMVGPKKQDLFGQKSTCLSKTVEHVLSVHQKSGLMV
jgi:hypothetical protein